MDILKSIIMAAIPLMLITHLVTYYSYRRGKVRIENDEHNQWETKSSRPLSDSDDIDDELWFSDKTKNKSEKLTNNLLHQKWINFGGGFYGLMALVTFFVIEVQQALAFVSDLPSGEDIQKMLSINGLVHILLDRVMNMIDAFVWFQFWPKTIDIANGWIWLGAAYAGYFIGRKLAELRLKA